MEKIFILLSRITKSAKSIIKITRLYIKRIGLERLFLYIVILFAAVSFLIVVENDFDGETWDMGNGIIYAEQARVNNVPLIDYLFKKFPEGNTATSAYETGIMFIPLWQTLVYSGWKILGSISTSVRVWLALIGFSTVITLFFVGKSLYGLRVGFLAAITLATSIFYIIHVKSGFGYYAIMPLFVLLLFYFFYQAHAKRKVKYLYYCGILIFLLLFNGWPTMALAAQIMVAFMLINFNFKKILTIPKKLKIVLFQSIDGDEKSKLLGLKDYLAMGLIGGGLFFISGILYSFYFKGQMFDVFEKIYIYWYSSRASWIKYGQFLDPGVFFPNVSNLIKSFVWQMPFNERAGYLTTLISPEAPIITHFTLLFFIIGIVILIKRRLLFDKLCLIWLFFELIGTTILAGFTARNWLFAVTCIALVSAIAIDQALTFFQKKLSKGILKNIIIGSIVIGFIYSAFSTYNYYFFYFVKHNSFLGWAAKQSEVAKFIMSVASPKDSLIVLDYYNPLTKSAFHFFTSGKGYQTIYYWSEITDSLKKNSPEDLLEWEQKILGQKEKIIYAISQGNYSHYARGVKLWGVTDTSAFKTIHADLAPAKVVYYQNNIPAFKIYVVTRKDISLYKKEFNLKKNSDQYFWLDKKGANKVLEIKGQVTDGKICFNSSSCVSLPFPIRSGETFRLGKNHSEINFSPITTLKESEVNIYEKEDIKLEKKDDSVFITSTAPKGYVVYKIVNVARIKHVSLQIFPRINNDKEGKNKFTVQFSEDGKKYRTIFIAKSNKGKYWEWPYLINTTTLSAKASSNEVYIKFLFEGKTGESQIWSSPDNMTMFTIMGEGWSDVDLNLEKGINKVKFTGKEENAEIAVYINEKINKLEHFGFINKDQNSSNFELDKGLYHLWVATKGKNRINNVLNRNETIKLEMYNSSTEKQVEFTPNDFNNSSRVFKFIDFSLPDKSFVSVLRSDPTKDSLIDYWGIIPSNKIFTADELSGKDSNVVVDPSSLFGKAMYLNSKWTPKGKLLEENLDLKQGKYLVRLSAKFKDKNKEKVAKLKISSEEQSKLNTEMYLSNINSGRKNAYQEFIVPFEITNPKEKIKLELEFLGESELWLDSLEIFYVDKTVEAETLSLSPYTKAVDDNDASGGKTVYQGTKNLTLSGYIVYGDVAIKLPKGDYVTFYRMKAEDNLHNNSLIQIENVSKDFVYEKKDIWANDFASNNEYQYFSLPMLKFDPDAVLSFKGLWYPKTSAIWIDSISIGILIKKYQIEELSPEETQVDDNKADGGKSVFIQGELVAKNKTLEGVIYNFSSENFQTVLRLKTGSVANLEDIANVTFYNLLTGEKIGEKKITNIDLSQGVGYQNIKLNLKRNFKGPISFVLKRIADVDLRLDYIDFIPFD